MSDDSYSTYARWRGTAQVFCDVVREVYSFMIMNSKSNQAALSVYGRIGYGNNYTDYLARIDSAIEKLRDARVLFIEAESLREKIERSHETP